MMMKTSRVSRSQYTFGWNGCIWQPDIYHGYARESWCLPMIILTECHQAQRDGWILEGRKAYMGNRKSLWALAWLTLVVTLVGIEWAPDSGQRSSLEDHVSIVLFSNNLECEDVKGGIEYCG
ncbi:hypothetical protein VPH35_013758 [Triticum aestivum]